MGGSRHSSKLLWSNGLASEERIHDQHLNIKAQYHISVDRVDSRGYPVRASVSFRARTGSHGKMHWDGEWSLTDPKLPPHTPHQGKTVVYRGGIIPHVQSNPLERGSGRVQEVQGGEQAWMSFVRSFRERSIRGRVARRGEERNDKPPK
jgi:hypothetical protein